MEGESTLPPWPVMVLVIILFCGAAIFFDADIFDNGQDILGSVTGEPVALPTLMPTPALAVPTSTPVPPYTPPPADVVVNNSPGSSVSVTNNTSTTNVNVRVCIMAECP